MPNTSKNGIVVELSAPYGTGPYLVRQLLSDGDSNVKLSKSNKSGKGYLTLGLSLSPANESGFNTCARASEGCKKACIFTSGRGGLFPAVNRARVAKTLAFFGQRDAFFTMLRRDLERGRAQARRKGLTLAVRLNVFSDLPWERIAPWIFTEFRDVQFYDYTKVPGRVTPRNYHLTFSRSEVNEQDALAEYARGRNVAVVFDSKELPKRWNGKRVLNGDETDLRFLDRRGIVGLYAKGDGRKDASGFVVPSAKPKAWTLTAV